MKRPLDAACLESRAAVLDSVRGLPPEGMLQESRRTRRSGVGREQVVELGGV